MICLFTCRLDLSAASFECRTSITYRSPTAMRSWNCSVLIFIACTPIAAFYRLTDASVSRISLRSLHENYLLFVAARTVTDTTVVVEVVILLFIYVLRYIYNNKIRLLPHSEKQVSKPRVGKLIMSIIIVLNVY